MAYNNSRRVYPVRAAPKRRIERVQSTVLSAIGVAVVTSTIHVCEDSKTLVRIRGRLTWAGPQVGIAGITVAVAPGSTAISANNPVVAVFLDQDVSDTMLFRITEGAGAGELAPHVFDIDSQAMRKLKVGDTIVLKVQGSNAAMGDIVGTLDMWFKE